VRKPREPRATALSSRSTRTWGKRHRRRVRGVRSSRRRPACCGHFLDGRGHGGQLPGCVAGLRLAAASTAFQVVKRAGFQTAIARRLKDGDTGVRLAAWQLPTVTFSTTNSDLYWSFRGTQGLSVAGSGVRESGRYVGTLTYVVRDSTGFPSTTRSTASGRRCGTCKRCAVHRSTRGGANWFPDTVTVTVPFDQPA